MLSVADPFPGGSVEPPFFLEAEKFLLKNVNHLEKSKLDLSRSLRYNGRPVPIDAALETILNYELSSRSIPITSKKIFSRHEVDLKWAWLVESPPLKLLATGLHGRKKFTSSLCTA